METRGSVGIENKLTEQEIREADVVILGVGVSVINPCLTGKRS